MHEGTIGRNHCKATKISPEGERSFDGDLHGFKKGAAILATELDLPMVPVAIDGLYKVWARKSWRIRPAKVKITIGKPFYAKEVVSRQLSAASGSAASNEQLTTNDELYELVTDHLKKTISDM